MPPFEITDNTENTESSHSEQQEPDLEIMNTQPAPKRVRARRRWAPQPVMEKNTEDTMNVDDFTKVISNDDADNENYTLEVN